MLTLAQETWNEISRHAVDAFPEECCGVIIEYGRRQEVRRCKNIQNMLHAHDPRTFPRDATIAYTMDMNEFNSILRETDSSGATVKAFYHSHPGHEAYFSDEDKAFAIPFGEPTFPEAAQIVISVYDRMVKHVRAYAWSQEKKDFFEIALRTV